MLLSNKHRKTTPSFCSWSSTYPSLLVYITSVIYHWKATLFGSVQLRHLNIQHLQSGVLLACSHTLAMDWMYYYTHHHHLTTNLSLIGFVPNQWSITAAYLVEIFFRNSSPCAGTCALQVHFDIFSNIWMVILYQDQFFIHMIKKNHANPWKLGSSLFW